MNVLKSLLLGASAASLLVSASFAQDKRVLVYNADYDPIPLAAMEALIADFEAANPDIDVKINNFDHEGYKTAIRNFLTADAPDLANWYAGNRMAPFVNAGQFQDVSDVWTANNLGDALGFGQGLDDHRRQAVGNSLHLLPVGHLLQQGRLQGSRCFRAQELGRVRRQLREVQGRQHRLPDHGHQGAVAWSGHLRLPVAAHQRL